MDFLHKRSVVRSFQYVYYISSSAIVRNIRGVRYIGRERSQIEVTGRRIICISKHVIHIKLSLQKTHTPNITAQNLGTS